MSLNKRLSQSSFSATASASQTSFIAGSDSCAPQWVEDWRKVLARDLIDTRIVAVDADCTVEEACEKLLSEDIPCLAVRTDPTATDGENASTNNNAYQGLFDFSDVNAFLTLAATRHTFSLDDTTPDPRHTKIVEAAKAGRVPVQLVSNLSDKNPFTSLPNDADVVQLLEIFARGTHRVLIQAPDHSGEPIGMVSDRGLLEWFFSTYAKSTSPSFQSYLLNPIQPLSLPSLNIYTSVVAAGSSASVLDAIKLMSEEGVSSIAVLDEELGGMGGVLCGAVSVTDIGKVLVPSQNSQILGITLAQFISMIKEPMGSTDGVDRYPVYSVLPSSTLQYTIEKLLATNAHRLFVTRESTLSSPVLSPSAIGNLCGIVSIVDILSLFAHLANVDHIDPTEMQRHRRMSSAGSKAADHQQFVRSASRSSSISSQSRSRRRSGSASMNLGIGLASSIGAGIGSPGVAGLTSPGFGAVGNSVSVGSGIGVALGVGVGVGSPSSVVATAGSPSENSLESLAAWDGLVPRPVERRRSFRSNKGP